MSNDNDLPQPEPGRPSETPEGRHRRTVRRRIPAFGMGDGECPEIEEELKEDRPTETIRQPDPGRPSGTPEGQPSQVVRRRVPAFGQEKLDRIAERGGQGARDLIAEFRAAREKSVREKKAVGHGRGIELGRDDSREIGGR